MNVEARHCQVLRNEWVNARYKRLELSSSSPLAHLTSPGQFYQIICPVTTQESPFLPRPMSVYGIGPESNQIEFLYHVKGTGTRTLATLKHADALEIIGPLGIGFDFSPQWKHVLLVARGVGLATLAPLVPLALKAGISITAVLSARSPDDLMEAAFLRGAQAVVLPVFDSDGSSAVDRLEGPIRQIVERDRPDMVYTCGSNRLVALLQKLNVHGQVALEQQMACGMGVCLSCVRLFSESGCNVFRRVCCEGPVFPLSSVTGDIRFG